MPKPKRVAILHADDRSMDMVLAGIEEVRRAGNDWDVWHQYNPPRNADEVASILAFKPDGMISASGDLPASLQQPDFPWVSLRNRQSPLAVVLDDHAAGLCAAEHLIGLGAASLAWLLGAADGMRVAGWRRSRFEGFQAGLAKHGREIVNLHWDDPVGRAAARDAFLARIAALAKPVAIFAGNDWFAFEAMEALLSAGVRIPADVALLGADDVPRCAGATVPLSSVRVAHQESGRRAALLLAEAMAGCHRSPQTIVVPPDGVAGRASTDAIAIRDPEVAEIMRLIRMRIGEPFDVGDVVVASRLSRRSLEQRFRRLLGRTILDEIHRCRIEHAQSMLRTSEAPVVEIAAACGFADAPHFTVVFRKQTGTTPSAWRAQHRQNAAG